MKRIPFGRSAVFALGVASLAALAGCHSSAPEETVANNMTDAVEVANTVVPENVVAPTEAPATNAAAVPSNPGADFATDSHTYDDADATGMTARIPQDNGSEPAQ